MSKGWQPGCGLGLLYGMAGLATIIGVLRLGPFDLARTVYNQIIGDTSALKRELVDYCREGIGKDNLNMPQSDIELKLANCLGVKLTKDGKIDSNEASIEELFDASEDYAHSKLGRWVWPSLGK